MPAGIKELEPVAGWPFTEASLVFRDRIADRTTHDVERLLERGGAVPVGQTTASEFGGLNVSVTKLNGVTHNPWRHGRTVGGSSSGSAAAVAGGLVSLATGRRRRRVDPHPRRLHRPARHEGHVRSHPAESARVHAAEHGGARQPRALGARRGPLLRRVRGYDPADPSSLPKHPGFEAGLGTHELAGKRVAIVPSLGGVTLEPGVEEQLRAEADALIASTGMVQVDVDVDVRRTSPRSG